MNRFIIVMLAIFMGVIMPKGLPKRTSPYPIKPPKIEARLGTSKPKIQKKESLQKEPKGTSKPRKRTAHDDKIMELYQRLDDWQYAGPLPYDTIYRATPDPYPMPEFDKRVKAND